MNVLPFEIIFIILTAVFLLITVIWCLRLLLNHETEKAGKVLLSSVISIFAAGIIFIGIFVISAILSLMRLPIEYGLNVGLIITPIIAFIIHFNLARNFLSK